MSMNNSTKTEHAGAKNRGGFGGTRERAKRISKVIRRRRDKQESGAKPEQGFTVVEVLIGVAVLVLVIFAGLHAYATTHRNGLVKRQLAIAQLSFWYPNNWKITANDQGTNSGYFEIKSPSGFVLGFQEANASFFSGGNPAATKSIAAEVIKINGIGSGVVSADSGKYSSITVVNNTPRVGAAFYPDDLKYLPASRAIQNMYVQINGGFNNQTFASLHAFDDQTSVKQAKAILQSLKFN